MPEQNKIDSNAGAFTAMAVFLIIWKTLFFNKTPVKNYFRNVQWELGKFQLNIIAYIVISLFCKTSIKYIRIFNIFYWCFSPTQKNVITFCLPFSGIFVPKLFA